MKAGGDERQAGLSRGAAAAGRVLGRGRVDDRLGDRRRLVPAWRVERPRLARRARPDARVAAASDRLPAAGLEEGPALNVAARRPGAARRRLGGADWFRALAPAFRRRPDGEARGGRPLVARLFSRRRPELPWPQAGRRRLTVRVAADAG